MDRYRAGSPVYSRQQSGGSSNGSSSPAMSPATTSSSALSNIKRNKNVPARAAAACLAQVMASSSAADNDDDDADDLVFAAPASASAGAFRYGGSRASSNGSSLLVRTTRSPSPSLGRNIVEQIPPIRSTSVGRPLVSARTAPLVPPSRTSLRSQAPIPPIELPVARSWEKRKEAALLKREAALKAASQTKDGRDEEIASLREEVEFVLLSETVRER